MHDCPAQQASFSPPHATHVPVWQVSAPASPAAAWQVPPPASPVAPPSVVQHGFPSTPQTSWHVLLEESQTVFVRLQVAPLQHGCRGPPQLVQLPLTQRTPASPPHDFPHVPQLLGSMLRSVHLLPPSAAHSARPASALQVDPASVSASAPLSCARPSWPPRPSWLGPSVVPSRRPLSGFPVCPLSIVDESTPIPPSEPGTRAVPDPLQLARAMSATSALTHPPR